MAGTTVHFHQKLYVKALSAILLSIVQNWIILISLKKKSLYFIGDIVLIGRCLNKTHTFQEMRDKPHESLEISIPYHEVSRNPRV